MTGDELYNKNSSTQCYFNVIKKKRHSLVVLRKHGCIFSYCSIVPHPKRNLWGIVHIREKRERERERKYKKWLQQFTLKREKESHTNRVFIKWWKFLRWQSLGCSTVRFEKSCQVDLAKRLAYSFLIISLIKTEKIRLDVESR